MPISTASTSSSLTCPLFTYSCACMVHLQQTMLTLAGRLPTSDFVTVNGKIGVNPGACEYTCDSTVLFELATCTDLQLFSLQLCDHSYGWICRCRRGRWLSPNQVPGCHIPLTQFLRPNSSPGSP